ncbi:MAG: hypothetical protein R3F42_03235 [Pseudomonadota bacterium]
MVTANGKHVVLGLLAATALLAGLLEPLLGARGGPAWLDMVLSLGCAILVFTWYIFDTDEHAYRRTPLLNAMVVAAGVVAIPYYLLRSRGGQQGLRACGLFLLALALWFALAAAGLGIGELLFGA